MYCAVSLNATTERPRSGAERIRASCITPSVKFHGKLGTLQTMASADTVEDCRSVTATLQVWTHVKDYNMHNIKLKLLIVYKSYFWFIIYTTIFTDCVLIIMRV